ncbi:MAG: 1-acyl-sn-glycerol-3-phosphate acyltransferase [Gemmatimonadales bacterium]|nr:1-acyl-sn-glycerol-3-phosphate acyltransferase [Gemmatimonadales bacterium]
MIRAIRFILSVSILTVVVGSRLVVLALRRVRHRPGDAYDRVNRQWAEGMLRWNRVRATLEGVERLTPGQPYVFVANHVSHIEIWVLLARLPGSVRFIYKRELERVPVFGQAIVASGHIPIDRQKPNAAFAAYNAAARRIQGGTSAIVFAEGTRSSDGKLMPLKKGPFVLAVAAQVPVVPVAVLGAFESMPKGSISPKPVPITIRIGEPIPTTGLGYEDRDQLSRQCRAALLAMGVPE